MTPRDLRTRLDELERESRLEKLLAKDDDPSLSLADMAFLLMLCAYLGLVIHIVRMAQEATATKASPPPAEFAWLVLLALVAVALQYGGRLLQSRSERLLLRLRKQGEVVPAALVMVNQAWFDEENTRWWPGAIVLSSDPRASAEPALLQATAKALFRLRQQDRRQLPPDQVELAWDLYHEMGPGPSLPVPAALSHGLRNCVLASAKLPPAPLANGPLLAALVLPGETSPDGVRVLPAAVRRDGPNGSNAPRDAAAPPRP